MEELDDVVVDAELLAPMLLANAVDVDARVDDVEVSELEEAELDEEGKLDVKATEDVEETAEEVAIITDVILKEEDETYCDEEAMLALFELELIDDVARMEVLTDDAGFTDTGVELDSEAGFDDVARTDVLWARLEVGMTEVPRFSGAGVGIAII